MSFKCFRLLFIFASRCNRLLTGWDAGHRCWACLSGREAEAVCSSPLRSPARDVVSAQSRTPYKEPEQPRGASRSHGLHTVTRAENAQCRGFLDGCFFLQPPPISLPRQLMGAQGVPKPPASFFSTSGGWSLFRSNPTQTPFGPGPGGGVTRSPSLQFSWPAGEDSNFDCETCSLALPMSWQNEKIALFCGVNDRNGNVTGAVSTRCAHAQMLGADICRQFFAAIF